MLRPCKSSLKQVCFENIGIEVTILVVLLLWCTNGYIPNFLLQSNDIRNFILHWELPQICTNHKQGLNKRENIAIEKFCLYTYKVNISRKAMHMTHIFQTQFWNGFYFERNDLW